MRTIFHAFCVLSFVAIALSTQAIERTTSSSPDQQWQRLRAEAENGHPGAQYLLGQYYFQTIEAYPQNAVLAQQWFIRAAQQGHANAALRAGEMAHYGDGIARNFDEAAKWYLTAAELGSAEAMDYLGLFYVRGLGGLPKDCTIGFQWFDRAFKAGYQDSLNNLIFGLATNDAPHCRDGKRALSYAQMALQLKPDMEAGWLDTMAAAYAENGLFAKAVELQKTALQKLQAEEDVNADRIAKFNARLQLYQNHKTWRGTSAPVAENYGDPVLESR